MATQLETKSPFANFVACIMVILTCFFLTSYIEHVPLASLSGLVIISLKTTLQKILYGQTLYLESLNEGNRPAVTKFRIWVITFFSVVIIDPAAGILLGMFISAILMYYQ